MSYVGTKTIKRQGLSGYVRTGYVRTGLGGSGDCQALLKTTIVGGYGPLGTGSVLKRPGIKLSAAELDCVLNSDYGIIRGAFKTLGSSNRGYSAKEVSQILTPFLKSLHPSDVPAALSAMQRWLKNESITRQNELKSTVDSLIKAVSAPSVASTGLMRTTAGQLFVPSAKPAGKPTIQVGLTQAQAAAMTPEEKAAYDAKMAAAAQALAVTQANAIRIADHSGGVVKYVRDNTPEGLKAQAEGRLQTVEQGGSGILTPPTPEQAASPTPVTPDGTQPIAQINDGGLFSGPLPWIIGGGALLAVLLLTRKKNTASTP